MFDPIDDGSTEDDFFDPADPDRRLGPSTSCYPNFVMAYQGDTDEPFDPLNTGAAFGPGLQGSLGIGTWVESAADLSTYRGSSVRLRFLSTGLKAGTADPIDDGWWIDDVRIDDTLASPAVLAVDTNPNDVLPGCGSTCDVIVPSLAINPASAVLTAPGNVVERCAAPVPPFRGCNPITLPARPPPAEPPEPAS